MNKQILTLCIALLVGLVSCSKSLQDIIKHTEDASFIIYTYDEFGSPYGSGSGFFIDANGTGITNYHVLNGATKAYIRTSDEAEYEIDSIIGSDEDWDILKFTIKGEHSQFKYLNFSKKDIQKGDEVYNISSPLGLEKTVSNGIVSSLRNDQKHGDIVQVTAPISPGSSGSPLLDKNGNVFAVATFLKQGGQNLNFGVLVDKEKVDKLINSDFSRSNNKFNSKSNFVILNLPSDKGADITLNAIEFGENATTVYMSYTHLNLMGADDYYVWVELNQKEEGFMIEDLDSHKEYYVISSTIGIDKTNATGVSLGTTTQFRVFLPPIKDKIGRFTVYGCGKNDNRWVFKDIDLNRYNKSNIINTENYKRDYALASLREGELNHAHDLLTELIENNPNDAIALNTLGIISYIADNNSDALYYFSEAIKENPNHDLGYINRHVVYKYQNNYSAALDDISKAISIEPDQPDNLIYRADLYMDLENWTEAKKDIDKAIKSDDFKNDIGAYMYRIYVNAHLNSYTDVCNDIRLAFKLADTKDIKEQLQDLWYRFGCK